ncbi:MAG: hypothetical protein HY800_00685 [Ignavibacteriales bacterium]|nr:hypothetical protein [Ignavibacteriales bacterium]
MSDQSNNIEHISQPMTASDSPKVLGDTILDFFSIVTRWRKFITWFVLSITIVTTIIALVSPRNGTLVS